MTELEEERKQFNKEVLELQRSIDREGIEEGYSSREIEASSEEKVEEDQNKE